MRMEHRDNFDQFIYFIQLIEIVGAPVFKCLKHIFLYEQLTFIALFQPTNGSKDMSLEFIRLTMLTAGSSDANDTNQKMLNAVANRDKKALQALIENGAWKNNWNDVYEFLNNKKRLVNPMELACTLGYVDFIYLFLDCGCNPNLPTNAGRLIHTVLESIKSEKISLFEGRKLVHLLCKDGCNVNIRGTNHKTSFLLAAELGDADILKILVTFMTDPSILKVGDINDFSPLHMSCMRGDLDCVLILLPHCCTRTVNKHDSHFCTPMQLALSSINKNITYMNSLVSVKHSEAATKSSELLQKTLTYMNSSVNVQNSEGTTKSSEQLQKIRQLQYNSIAIVEALLIHGAEINGPNSEFYDSSRGTYAPIYQALRLVCKDETFEKYEKDSLSLTMQLVTRTKLQDLNRAMIDSDDENESIDVSSTVSPYAGLFRLLVLFGADPIRTRTEWQTMFSMNVRSEVIQLIDEMFYFWENSCDCQGPPKLIQISKQTIRNILAKNQSLHEIDKLPLPNRMISFIKLQCL